MLKWDFTLFRVQGAWTLKVHGLEPQSQTCAPVVDAPTCGRLGFFFILIEIFSQLYTGCDFNVFISTDAFNGNSETCTKIMNTSCIHLPRQLCPVSLVRAWLFLWTCILSSIQWSSPCYFFFLKTSNLEAFQIKINSADDRLRSRNLYLHTHTGKTEGMFMKSTAR